MTELAFKPATRQGVRPLIVFYGESGTGKTFTALHVARGIAGPNGKVRIIDTESERSRIYADIVPGGYDILDLGPPFTPQRYIEAITEAEDSGTDVLVIDSMSHEWEGIGGVLEMAGDIEESSGKPGLHCWRKPKFEHQKLIQKLLGCRIKTVIVCLRAKYKSRPGKDEKGKSIILKDEFVTPIQSEEFIFEATVHLEILQNHCIRLTKGGHPELEKCFPADNAEPMNVETGRLIAEWCNAPTLGGPQKPAVPPIAAPLKTAAAMLELKKRLIARVGPHFDLPDPKHHEFGIRMDKVKTALREKGILQEGENLATLTEERMAKLVEDVEAQFEAKW